MMADDDLCSFTFRRSEPGECKYALLARLSSRAEMVCSAWQVGFFIRLVPAEGVFAKLDELGQPRFLVVSFTSDMSMVAWMPYRVGESSQSANWRFHIECFGLSQSASQVSRVHSDTLRTLAVGPGLHDDRQVGIGLTFDLAGNLSLHVEPEVCTRNGRMAGCFQGRLRLLRLTLPVADLGLHTCILRTRSSCWLSMSERASGQS